VTGPAAQRPVAEQPDAKELFRRCTRFLGGHGLRRPDEVQAEIASVLGTVESDRYGEGGVVAALERETAELLGKPAAVVMPSGTMAQQSVLRIHADRIGSRVVVWHPTCHLALHEDQAAERLQALLPRPVGDASRLMTVADLEKVAEPYAALLVELPQREIGGQLPSWDDLGALVAIARGRGAAVHLDGARLLESLPFYERSAAEVADLFDTVYLSLYKGLGGVAGCVLAGPECVIAQAREWRHRLGGTLFGLWPYAAAGLAGLRLRADRFPAYVAHARAIGAALRDIDDVDVVPDPPQTSMMHLHVRAPADRLLAAVTALAERDRVGTWAHVGVTDVPAVQRLELSVGDATMEWAPAEVAAVVAGLMKEARA
jgi:threonine aldolase